MGRKRYTVEQIIRKLREAEIELGRGLTTPQACRKIGISEQTYYRWRKRYGGMQVSQAKRLKDLEQENARLKKLLAESMLDKAILEEATSGNFCARQRDAGLSSMSVGVCRSPSVGRAAFWVRREPPSGIGPEPRTMRFGWSSG